MPESARLSTMIRFEKCRIDSFWRLFRSVPHAERCLAQGFLAGLWVRIPADLIQQSVPVELF
jgi:hypothetical protein